ncbi:MULTISPECIES: CBS domain-containing protein [Oxalobacteraceae]|uniref:CBS domain-containing protein n=1 Tax=Oxalobacteraceae TaxID=75682 RepID=UPI001455F242|nr:MULTISPECIES: CBS domain-containing protein [Oxalobacteraceae]HJV51121.1 CBS domain-containing protein [Noviherbaspirillum sp.]HJV81894.1 CBS domain-containing protein [Noviherbaspirillum sp.]
MGEKMDIGEVCNRSVVFVTEEMSVKTGAQLMRDEHVGSLVVVREAPIGRVVTGIVTDRDIAVIAVARDFDPQSLRIADIMTADPVTARPSDSISDVLGIMRQRGIRRVPVTDEQSVLIGIVTLDDLLEVVAEEMQAFVQAITNAHKREVRVRG